MPSSSTGRAAAQPRAFVPPHRLLLRSRARSQYRSWDAFDRSFGPPILTIIWIDAATHVRPVTWLTKSPLRNRCSRYPTAPATGAAETAGRIRTATKTAVTARRMPETVARDGRPGNRDRRARPNSLWDVAAHVAIGSTNQGTAEHARQSTTSDDPDDPSRALEAGSIGSADEGRSAPTHGRRSGRQMGADPRRRWARCRQELGDRPG